MAEEQELPPSTPSWEGAWHPPNALFFPGKERMEVYFPGRREPSWC